MVEECGACVKWLAEWVLATMFVNAVCGCATDLLPDTGEGEFGVVFKANWNGKWASACVGNNGSGRWWR